MTIVTNLDVDIEAITYHIYESNYHRAIAEIDNATYDVAYTSHEIREYLMAVTSFCRAAFRDREIVGYMLFTTTPKIWYLDRLAVHHRYRRKGIGTQLMKSFLNTKRRPAASVTILDERLLPGCIFLRSCGWKCNINQSAINEGRSPDLLHFEHNNRRIR